MRRLILGHPSSQLLRTTLLVAAVLACSFFSNPLPSQSIEWKLMSGTHELVMRPTKISIDVISTGPYVTTSASVTFKGSSRITHFLHKLSSPYTLTGWGMNGQNARAVSTLTQPDSAVRTVTPMLALFPEYQHIQVEKGKPFTIKLEWEEWLYPSEGGYRHELPNILLSADSVHIKYSCLAQEFSPELKMNNGGAPATFKKVKDRFEWEHGLADPPAGTSLRVFMPYNLNPWTFYMERSGKDSYFLACTRHNLESRPAKPPLKIALVWEASATGAGREHDVEMAVLDALMHSSRRVEVDLIPFSTHEHGRQKIVVEDGQTAGLQRALTTLNYDGAAAPGNINWQSVKGDWIVFVGEGTVQWGKAPDFQPKGRFVSYYAGTPSRNAWLEKAAFVSNGIHLGRVTDPFQAMKTMVIEHPRTSKIAHGSMFSEMYAVEGLPPGLMAVTGKFHDKTGKFTASAGFGNEAEFKATHTLEWDAPRGKGNRIMLLNRRTMLKSAARLQQIPAPPLLDQCLKLDLPSPWTKLSLIDETAAYLHGLRPAPPDFVRVDSLRKAYSEWEKARDSLALHQEKLNLLALTEEWNLRKLWWKSQDSTRKAKPKETAIKEVAVKNKFGILEDWKPFMTSKALRLEETYQGFRKPAWQPDHAPARYLVDGIPFDTLPDSILAMRLDYRWIEGAEAQGRMGRKVAGGVVSVLTPLALSSGWQHDGELLPLPWDSTQTYMMAMRSCPENRFESTYHQLKRSYGGMPAFYWDAAKEAGVKGLKPLQLQILSNLFVLPETKGSLLRSVGKMLMEEGRNEEAMIFLEKAASKTGCEPHAFRDLAFALEKTGNAKAASELFLRMLKMDWSDMHDYFQGIEAVLINDFFSMLTRNNLPRPKDLPKDLQPLPCDIRITASWNRMDVDVDLWVVEPDSFRCDHESQDSPAGAFFPVDFADGFGPEEYLLRRAKPGNYQIGIDYFVEDKPNFTGPSIVTVRVSKHFGTATEDWQEYDVELKGEKGSIPVITLEWPAPKP